MKQVLLIVLLVFVVTGCAAKVVPLNPNAISIKVGKQDPGEDYQEIGPISAKHGFGCGGYGQLGSYEGAYYLLKNRGFELSADYIQIIKVTEPYGDGQCFHNEYIIRGIAYKKQ